MIGPVKIELLYFPGCPNVEQTREVIKKALKSLSLDRLLVEEVDIHAPGSPEKYRNWPSPSILVDGIDVEGKPPTEAAACRIYPGGRAPRLEKIIEALKPIKNPRQLEKPGD